MLYFALLQACLILAALGSREALADSDYGHMYGGYGHALHALGYGSYGYDQGQYG